MKIFPSHSFLFQRGPKRGMALILVLSCLTLLSILVLAFLSSISTEVESSSSYANSGDVKQCSQTAINMVIAQIQDATSSSTIAWASQPGLIRTFNNTGGADKSYKLYSSANMVAEATFDPNVANVEVPTDWKTRPAEYTDLNQPMLVSDTAGTFAKDGIKYTPNYPILDPGALGTVKGFTIDGNSTPPDYGAINPLTNNPAAMPVQWLYMLKDGSLRAVNSLTGKVPDATSTNPIVSRLAFWTDDDTCKININTAAGDVWNNTTDLATYTDMPMAWQTLESNLQKNQPAQHEYQRYPGHPATTYLSAVFPNLTRLQIGDIIPRVKAGGSDGGTVPTYSGATPIPALALPLSDGLPLYASVDELRYVRSTSAATVRANQDTLFTPQDIERAKFFLTAHSRAPEVNLFNQPRITIWPEPAITSQRTAFDKTIAFCSTVGGQAFYFVRSDATSSTVDYYATDSATTRNRQLYSYLQTLTSQNVPGFGGNFLNKYPSLGAGQPSERDQILTEIFDYIRGSINLLDTATGGTPFAGSVYNGDLRFAPAGTGHVVPIQIGDTRGFGRSETLYCPILQIVALQSNADAASTSRDTNGDGYVKGTGAGTEKGDLAILTTTSVQALFVLDSFSPSQGPVRFIPDLVYKITGLDGLKLDGNPMGFPASAQINFNRYAPNHEYAWGGYTNNVGLFFEQVLGYNVPKPLGSGPSQYPFFGSVLPINKEYKKGTLAISGGDNIQLEIYSKDKTGTVSSSYIQKISLNFPDVTVPVPVVSGMYARTYSSTTDPTVKLSGTKVNAISGKTLDSPGPINYGYNAGAYGGQTIFEPSRSLVPSHGDMRLVMARKDVPKTVFVPGRGYTSPTDSNYKTLYYVQGGEENSGGMVGAGPRQGNNGGWTATSGKLVAGMSYDQHIGDNRPAPISPNDQDMGPMVSSLINGTQVTLKSTASTQLPGDWDNGYGGVVDGPYINKADEGEVGAGAYSSSNGSMAIASLFSPNRQAPSAVTFGSLPTGVIRDLPWQTLLFCPNSPAKNLHPGNASPPDHLFLDLFTMPVVEPYAISEPFSTAGKINLNYQIVPFTNIIRSTALQAVLRSTRITAIPSTDGLKYKGGGNTGSHITSQNPTPYRLNVALPQTLLAFQKRFDQNQIFRSASQICEMFLVPTGVGIPSSSNVETIMSTWWDDYKLTGDNLRERPYGQLYPRLTTKSNTYTVHVRVQTLKKAANNKPDQWIEGTDKVIGEYRGSYGIERYLDPNLTSYTLGTPLTAYKFRTLTTKQFTP